MRLGLVLRLASADWRQGLRDFGSSWLAFAVGVAAIAAAGSAAQAFREGLAEESRAILGGDVLVDLPQRSLEPEAVAWLRARARVAVTVEANAMADANGVRRLADAKAIDRAHPLEGVIEATDATGRPADAQTLLQQGSDGRWGALAEDLFFETFRVKPGDVVLLAGGEVRITGRLVKEPDALGAGFNFSPRIMISTAALPALGLGEPGPRCLKPITISPSPIPPALRSMICVAPPIRPIPKSRGAGATSAMLHHSLKTPSRDWKCF